jgi:hypothetical protein
MAIVGTTSAERRRRLERAACGRSRARAPEPAGVLRRLPARMRLSIAVLAAVALAAPAPGAAGELNFTPYVWIPGINGTIGTGAGGDVDPGLGDRVTVDFSPEFRIGGAMLNFSWREERFTAFGDWTYANVRATTPSPFGALYSEVKGQVIGNVFQLFSGYLLLDTAGMKLDAFVGGRGYAITTRLGLEPGVAGAADTSESAFWLDAAAGLRFNAVIARNWLAHLRADVGGGGSNLTWQAYAAGGYQFSRFALLAGWRHLYLDKGEGALQMKLSFSGPIVGVNFGF